MSGIVVLLLAQYVYGYLLCSYVSVDVEVDVWYCNTPFGPVCQRLFDSVVT